MNKKTIKLIQRVAKRLSEKYTFGYYSPEDIEQEAFIFAMESLPRFNPEISSLETFLFIHISNKLKTFKRDRYYRKDFVCRYCGRKDPNCEYCQRRTWKLEAKKHLMEPIDIDNINADYEKNMYIHSDLLSNMEFREIINAINENLDISLREDYLRMLEGVSIPRQKKSLIEDTIIGILDEYHRK